MPIYRNSTNHFAYTIRDDVRQYKYEERTTRFDRMNYCLHFGRVARRIRIETTAAITIRPNKRKKKKKKKNRRILRNLK